MAELVREALARRRARLLDVAHASCTARWTASSCPARSPTDDELLGIGRALGEVGHGVFEVASDLAPEGEELGWMKQLVARDGPARHVRVSAERRATRSSGGARCSRARRTARAGGHLTPQVAQRPAGLLLGWESTGASVPLPRGVAARSRACSPKRAPRDARAIPRSATRSSANPPDTLELPIRRSSSSPASTRCSRSAIRRTTSRARRRASPRSRSARAGRRTRSPTT